MPPKGRKPSGKKGPSKGTGGHGRDRLAGRKPTLPAEQRTGHPAQRRARRAAEAADSRQKAADKAANKPELVTGRNSVVEALQAGIPASVLFVAVGVDRDERVSTAIKLANAAGIPVHDVPRPDLDRLAGRGAVHQGLGLQVPPYEYAHPDELLTLATESVTPPLVVALDGVTDARNLGAIARSAAAFGAHGLLVPERRSAGVNAGAWKTSAGALSRLPVARATNLARTLKDYRAAGLFVVGLAADGDVVSADLELATEPLVVVVGSEGRGLSRLVREACDTVVSIPMAEGGAESLNAAVAASIALYDVARRRSRLA